MNASQVQNAIDLAIECSFKGEYYATVVEGIHGIGKSQIVAAGGAKYNFFKRNGRFIDLRLAIISEVGELVGNPSIDKETGVTRYYQPEWFPNEEPEIKDILNEELLSDDDKHIASIEVLLQLLLEYLVVAVIVCQSG